MSATTKEELLKKFVDVKKRVQAVAIIRRDVGKTINGQDMTIQAKTSDVLVVHKEAPRAYHAVYTCLNVKHIELFNEYKAAYKELHEYLDKEKQQ